MGQSQHNFTKILNHPDKNEIVEKLVAGESTRRIEYWLKQKYPHNTKNQVSYMTLHNFRMKELDLKGSALKEIAKERKEQEVARFQIQQTEKVEKIQSFRVALANYVQNDIIDYNNEILMLLADMKQGIEKLKEVDENRPGKSHLNHGIINDYIRNIQGLMTMHQKFVNDQEKRMKGNSQQDLEKLKQEMGILKEAIKEAFNRTNPEAFPMFVQIMKEKMNEAGIV